MLAKSVSYSVLLHTMKERLIRWNHFNQNISNSRFGLRSFAEDTTMSKHFYAVAKGRRPGVYNTWAECESQVSRYPGAIYKKFNSHDAAQKFIELKQESSCGTSTKSIRSLKRPSAGYTTKSLASGSNDIVGPPPAKSRSRIIEDSSEKQDTDNFRFDSEGYVEVYTDGACSANGRKGAVGGVGVWFGDNSKYNVSKPLHGVQTNNRAEIEAVKTAVEQAKSVGLLKVNINTDSQFLIKCIQNWMPKWKKNGWKTAKNEPVIHKNVLLELEKTMQGMKVRLIHVRGHAGIHGNEEADRLARAGCEQ